MLDNTLQRVMQPLSLMEEEPHLTSRRILQFENSQVSIKGTAASADQDRLPGETINAPRVEAMRNQAKIVEYKRSFQATTTAAEDEEMRHRDEQEILAKL